MDSVRKHRYSRQISVEEIGERGQELLLRSKVAVVGCGALGSMVAMQLAGAGIGYLCIADFDTVDISNLQRQFFFRTSEAGKSKTQLLAGRIRELNPEVVLEVGERLVTRELAETIFMNCDFVIDATDNPTSKLMIEEVCRKLHKPYCIAGVNGFHGQVLTAVDKGLGFNEVFAGISDSSFLPCSTGGVMGPAAALCASYQASEAIKYLSAIDKPTVNSLFVFDLYSGSFNTFAI